MTRSGDAPLRTSISEFLDSLFREELNDQTRYDPEVVQLVRKHLARGALYPRVGLRLAKELGQLAKTRAAGRRPMSWLGSRNGIVAKMSIAGVRGILDRGGDFELARDRSPESIALYAPSACGKSSYANAVEYLFSEDGSVAHLVFGRCCLLVRCGAQRANR